MVRAGKRTAWWTGTGHTGFVGLALLGVIAVWATPSPEPRTQRLTGITLDARRAPSPGAYDQLRDLGASEVALIPYAFFRDGELRFNPDGRWFSESDAGAIALAESLQTRGVGVTIKPQVWMRGGGFPGDLTFADEAGWVRFEASYRSYALHHARLAARLQSEWFVVGTELARSAIERPDFWRSLIREVRSVFPGKLTYAANWWGEVDSVAFWSELDGIGVQAYYPLATDTLAGESEFERNWETHSRGLAELASRWQKPILFTEVGYRSMTDAAIEPWAWTPRRQVEARANPERQAELYRAFFNGPWQESWMAGAFIWKWYGDGPSTRHSLDFTPQGKPSEDVIRQAYRAER